MRYRTSLVLTLAASTLATSRAEGENVAAPPTAGPAPRAIQLDLSKPFHTRSPWRLVVTQSAPVKDDYGEVEPGSLTLCLHKRPAGPCLPDPVSLRLRTDAPGDPWAWEPHYLRAARVVYPRGRRAAPLLLIVTDGLPSGDGNQAVSTQLVGYDVARDAFRRVYAKTTGHNNNEEVRFIASGPLRGDVISAEPRQRRPYGYWIVVETPTAAGTYRQKLRYRSATVYGDGNPLAVIDSEMPNIERRLGLWKPGQPLPAPRIEGGGKPCLKPVLKHTELWCE